MGLCFIGKRKFTKFIQEVCSLQLYVQAAIGGSWATGPSANWCIIILIQYLEERPGDFISLDGTVMGKHRGRQQEGA